MLLELIKINFWFYFSVLEESIIHRFWKFDVVEFLQYNRSGYGGYEKNVWQH